MNKRCTNCRLANFADADTCVRCCSELGEISSNTTTGRGSASVGRMLVKRGAICILTCLTAIIGFYSSLIVSARPLNTDENAQVEKSIRLLEEKGFTDEAYYLRNFAIFRGSDNWLNSLVPKENAYAATNYPFEIMTVYPGFFQYTEDDIERAAILLHEAKHLQGEDEKVAYEFVWRNRRRLGWTKEQYHKSVLWRNVRKQTKEYVPSLFICEFNEYSDCTKDL